MWDDVRTLFHVGAISDIYIPLPKTIMTCTSYPKFLFFPYRIMSCFSVLYDNSCMICVLA